MSKILNLSEAEVEALVALLKALRDHWSYGKDNKFERVTAKALIDQILKKLGEEPEN